MKREKAKHSRMAKKKRKKTEPKKTSGLVQRIKVWVSIIAAFVAIILGVPKIIELCRDSAPRKTSRFYGVVYYEDGKPVAGATVEVRPSSDSRELLGSGRTEPNGQFSFVVKAEPETAVWVTVKRKGHNGFADMQVLAGNKRLTFKAPP